MTFIQFKSNCSSLPCFNQCFFKSLQFLVGSGHRCHDIMNIKLNHLFTRSLTFILYIYRNSHFSSFIGNFQAGIGEVTIAQTMSERI